MLLSQLYRDKIDSGSRYPIGQELLTYTAKQIKLCKQSSAAPQTNMELNSEGRAAVCIADITRWVLHIRKKENKKKMEENSEKKIIIFFIPGPNKFSIALSFQKRTLKTCFNSFVNACDIQCSAARNNSRPDMVKWRNSGIISDHNKHKQRVIYAAQCLWIVINIACW